MKLGSIQIFSDNPAIMRKDQILLTVTASFLIN